MRLFAIDPGPESSAYVAMKNDYSILSFGKTSNKSICEILDTFNDNRLISTLVIEKPVCRKWAGREVSDTAIIAGVFAGKFNGPSAFITRSKVRGVLGAGKGGDAKVMALMIERFAPGVPNNGKGYATDPGPFHGFSDDIWQAFGLGVTYLDMLNKGGKEIDYIIENSERY